MEQNQTSWENFFRNDSSNMLEDALPYLPPNLKKIAALYIKLTELTNISTSFDNEQTLSACGLDQNQNSLELLLNAMKLRAPKETADQIDQILQMMQMFNIYQNYQRFIDTTNATPNIPFNELSSKNATTPNSDFINQLNQILKK